MEEVTNMTVLRMLVLPVLSAVLVAASLSACSVEHGPGYTSVAPAPGIYYHHYDED